MTAGERVFVTGGAGTIGSTVVDQLVRAGAAEIKGLEKARAANCPLAQ